MQVQEIPVQSVLNPTGGFLGGGFTHTINLYRGCALANSLCGLYCYAQWNPYHTRGRAWGSFLDAKAGFVEAYERQYDRLKRPGGREPGPIRIFMSSVTEPYPPQERTARRTRRLLDAMLERPPDLLVIQTHTTLVVDDLALLTRLAKRTRVRINVTVETDKPELPEGFPRHAFDPAVRMRALATVRAAGLQAVATVSPLLPLDDPPGFARALARVADRAILDHYLLGDGSPGGARTGRTRLPMLLAAAGRGDWATLDKFEEVVRLFRDAFGPERIGISRDGFNALIS